MGCRYRTRSLFVAFATALIVVMTVSSLSSGPTAGAQSPTTASGYAPGPPLPSFDDASFDVLPGSTVSLHWYEGYGASGPSHIRFVLTSTLPRFSSTSVVQWPSGTHPRPRWSGTSWITRSDAIKVKIPSNARPGAQYSINLDSCDSTNCSILTQKALLTVPSQTNWVTRTYRSDFPQLSTFHTPGSPFATTFQSSDDSIWNASEFSHNLIEIKNGWKKAHNYGVVSPASAPSVFDAPFANCNAGPCFSSSESAMSEQVISSDGVIWLTFGGWRRYEGTAYDPDPPNHSEVVAFDPTTKNFCTYLVPGNNNEVTGVASTGTAPDSWVWFVESRGDGDQPSLDGFNPSSPGLSCNGQSNQAFELPESVRLLKWSSTGGQFPVQVVIDPSSPTIWLTDFYGASVNGQTYNEIDRIDISDPSKPTVARRYVFPSTNPASVIGGKPWDAVAPPNSNYVYFIDNGDNDIVRINKTTNQLNEVQIPMTSDFENGFGLSIFSGRLYFTLADDFTQSFGAASTFGYIDLSSWPDDSAPKDGVIYTGLSRVTDPKTRANYRAIAAGPTGQIAITDQHQMIRLSP